MDEPAGTIPVDATSNGTSTVQVVRSFLYALEDLDVDRAMGFVDDAIVYQNVPLPPARGRAAFEKQMRTMTRYGTGFEAEIHNIAGAGDVVLTERTDVLEAGRLRAGFWVCGTFEVRNGRIVLWRDYFDWPTVTVALLKGAAVAAAGAITDRIRSR